MKTDPISIQPEYRYWSIDDDRLIENIKNGRDDFDRFVEEIEAYLVEH